MIILTFPSSYEDGKQERRPTSSSLKNTAIIPTFTALMKMIFTAIFCLMTAGCSSDQLTINPATPEDIQSQAALHRGSEAVLVNFWATTCAPCIEEFPFIMDLSRQYKQEGLQTYFVSIDFPDEEEKVRRFLKSQRVSGISFLADLSDPNAFINSIHKNWTGAVPFTIMFAKGSGEVVDYWEGEKPKKHFEQAIRKALKS